MTEYRFVNFRKPASTFIPPSVDNVRVSTIDFAGSVPELSASMDGWEAVSFQVTPLGEDVLLTFLLRTEVDAASLLPPQE
ncbi:hypothetical protein ACTXI9_01430 [Brachybacterium alimentarium]|uniref:hypothetical protein n=1 Tax=Brachybacterium alimentarium TaxID=47845 RepID=UPI003FD1F5D0